MVYFGMLHIILFFSKPSPKVDKTHNIQLNKSSAYEHSLFVSLSSRVPLNEVLIITNQGYWLLMVKIELSDRLKLIKQQMKIFQALR